MKMIKPLLPFGLALLLLSGCGHNHPASADASEIVDSANEKWNTAFNLKDVEALTKLYAPQATLSAGDGKILKGQEEIANLFQGFFDNGLHNHTIETVETYSSAGQVTQLANWSAEVAGENGDNLNFNGVLVTVLQQNEDHEWQVVSHIWNMAQ